MLFPNWQTFSSRCVVKEKKKQKTKNDLIGFILFFFSEILTSLQTNVNAAIDAYDAFPFPGPSVFSDGFLHSEALRLMFKNKIFDDARIEKHMIG